MIARLEELVVGSARDDRRGEVRYRVVVHAGAERARGEHFAVDHRDLVDVGDGGAELALGALGLELVDIGDGELRAGGV